jgi:hypothetical protein
MTYKILAYKKTSQTRPVETPAIVSDRSGNLALITATSPQFEPVPDAVKASYMHMLQNGAPGWWHTSTASPHEWRPGTYVATDHEGNYHLRGAEEEADKDDDGDAPASRVSLAAADPYEPQSPADFPEVGKHETLTGDATNCGQPFRYAVHLTTCHACVNFNPQLRVKPCRLSDNEVTPVQQEFYEHMGLCPFFKFGWTVNEGDDVSETRGALIKALGGEVMGDVSQELTLSGDPRKMSGWVGSDDDSEGGENDATGDTTKTPNAGGV